MSGDDEDPGEPLYIGVERFLADRANAEAAGVAMDLIARVWWPLKTPFVFDEDALAARLASELPARGYTAEMLRRRRYNPWLIAKRTSRGVHEKRFKQARGRINTQVF